VERGRRIIEENTCQNGPANYNGINCQSKPKHRFYILRHKKFPRNQPPIAVSGHRKVGRISEAPSASFTTNFPAGALPSKVAEGASLFRPTADGTAVAKSRRDQKFFGSFFQKRTVCSM
jgi:hypothetical protein